MAVVEVGIEGDAHRRARARLQVGEIPVARAIDGDTRRQQLRLLQDLLEIGEGIGRGGALGQFEIGFRNLVEIETASGIGRHLLNAVEEGLAIALSHLFAGEGQAGDRPWQPRQNRLQAADDGLKETNSLLENRWSQPDRLREWLVG